jgi:hypothetical protein
MPNLDKTGPEGKGPMTGRGAGKCSENDTTEKPTQNQTQGLGLGRGLGRKNRGPLGRGRRNQAGPVTSN